MNAQQAALNLYNRKEITLDEYRTIEKTAALPFGQASKAGLTGLWDIINKGAVGIGLGAGATIGGMEIAKAINRHNEINSSYKQLQEKVPQLSEYPQEKIKDYFEVVKKFSPLSASNPLVAGAIVHKMLEFGGVDHKLVQDLTQIEHRPSSGLMFNVAGETLKNMTQLPG